MKKFAVELGLDNALFDQCLDSGKYTEFVNTQKNIAAQVGIQSTPAFLINGKAALGALPFADFQQIIEGFLTPAN